MRLLTAFNRVTISHGHPPAADLDLFRSAVFSLAKGSKKQIGGAR
jgi:hypothetical protein